MGPTQTASFLILWDLSPRKSSLTMHSKIAGLVQFITAVITVFIVTGLSIFSAVVYCLLSHLRRYIPQR